jgi:hypothetical protein
MRDYFTKNSKLRVAAILIATFVIFIALKAQQSKSQSSISPSGNSISSTSHASRKLGNANLTSDSSGKQILPLTLPPGNPQTNVENEGVLVDRILSDDDAILAKGRVSFTADTTLQSTHAAEIAARLKHLESLTSKDWGGQPNLLVNEIRAARGFQIPLDQVEALLAGKELYGWTEGQRNWIGDELMIMLRQEVPKEAYRIFQQVLADTNAPDAMRDYSIQHISHMVAANQVGAEGVAAIRAALDSGDPIYASTALISLHRLSASQPQFISPEQVAAMAQLQVKSTDQRIQLTAKAIRKEWEAKSR